MLQPPSKEFAVARHTSNLEQEHIIPGAHSSSGNTGALCLTRLAAGSGETPRNTVLRRYAVVYTSKDVTAELAISEADNAAQDSSNAAV